MCNCLRWPCVGDRMLILCWWCTYVWLLHIVMNDATVATQSCSPVLNLANCLFIKHTSDSSMNYNVLLNWAQMNFSFAKHSLDSSTNYTSFLNWLIMRCKFRPELVAEVQQMAISKMQVQVKSVYFNHPPQGNSANYYIILDPRDMASPPTSQQIGKFPPKRCEVLTPKRHPFVFFFLPHPQESSTLSESVRRTGRMFPEHVERSFLDPRV